MLSTLATFEDTHPNLETDLLASYQLLKNVEEQKELIN